MDPTPIDTNALLGGLLNLGSKFATPFANTLAYGEKGAQETALLEERLRLAALNGSGPNSAIGARMAPRSWQEFLFGNPANPATGAAASSGYLLPILAGLAVIVSIIFLARR